MQERLNEAVTMTTEPDARRVLRPTDAEAIRLAKTLVRTARHGALAVLEPGTGDPLASRVGVSTDSDGAPVTLISRLAAHTAALLADPRCSLLVGEPGRGDPLAHARISIAATARELPRGSDAETRVRARYLAHQPKARLYAELGDFRFFRLEPRTASLNGGFGRAYALTAADLLTADPANAEIAAMEAEVLAHMNEDHAEAVALLARHFAGASEGAWRIAGIDAEGIDLVHGDDMRRVCFETPLSAAAEIRPTLVRMAAAARQALGAG